MTDTLSYRRKFELTCSHFNGAEQYAALVAAEEFCQCGKGTPQEAFVLMLAIMRDTHGHNFQVVIDVSVSVEDMGALMPQFIIEDEVLEQIVRKYDRCNLSIHPRWYKYSKTVWHQHALQRVTTERLSRALVIDVLDAVSKRFPLSKERTLPGWCHVTVAVYETEQICATFTKSTEVELG